jgi:uncharacterized protein (DUF1330 family)
VSYYVVVTHTVDEPERYFQEYVPGTIGLIFKHQGEVVAAEQVVDVIEGNPEPRGCVILRFPSQAHFRSFYDDPGYVPLREVRYALTSARAMVGASEFVMPA